MFRNSLRSRQVLKCAEEAHFNAGELADKLHISRRQLQRCCLKCFGKPTHKVLQELRMRKAAKQLEAGLGVKQVSISLRYAHPNHFSRDFKKFFGVSPLKYEPSSGTTDAETSGSRQSAGFAEPSHGAPGRHRQYTVVKTF